LSFFSAGSGSKVCWLFSPMPNKREKGCFMRIHHLL
jgi:hypothetical protein